MNDYEQGTSYFKQKWFATKIVAGTLTGTKRHSLHGQNNFNF